MEQTILMEGITRYDQQGTNLAFFLVGIMGIVQYNLFGMNVVSGYQQVF